MPDGAGRANVGRYEVQPEADASMIRCIRTGAMWTQAMMYRESPCCQGHRNRIGNVQRFDDDLAAAIDAVFNDARGVPQLLRTATKPLPAGAGRFV